MQDTEQPDERTIALALALADAAGRAIRPHFRSVLHREDKPDASPVTAADRAAEAAMRAIIERERPADGIIGEEYGSTGDGAHRVWVLDPIDGTRAFIAGRPTFGTLIALLVDGIAALGIVDQPISGERWLGVAGRRTTLNGIPCSTRPCAGVHAAHLATTSPHLFTGDGEEAAFHRLRAQARDTIYGADCYNYALLASGHVDLVVESGLKLYDFAALVPVVEGAGGRMCDWEGRPLAAGSSGRVVAAGDRSLIPRVLELLGQ